jgi:LPS-assembly protein
MYKKVFFSLSLVSALYASDRYIMYALNVESLGDKVYANGSVVIYHDGSVYRAKSAVYDRKTKLLKLLDDVTVIQKKSIVKSKNIDIKVGLDGINSDKFFIFDSSSGLWLRGSKYFNKGKDIQIIKNSEISSCDVQNPDWKILFSKAKYNKNIEFISLYKPTFYFKGKPIFGLPFFAFPTVRKRTSGLLRPQFGLKVDSGFIYMQPYFYAPKKNWDIEITPQIRTKRGEGLYSTLLFVDTPYSKGKLTFGSFYDKKGFYHSKNLKNSSHYGFDFLYKSTKVFDKYYKSSSEDGLWIDFHYLNDIDYENLKDINIKSLNKLVTSRFNYFFKRDRDYIGVYGKYFIDTDKDDNSNTLQELPTFQYHKFTTTLPLKNLIYSIDCKAKNNYRKDGLNATMYEVNFPLKLDLPLLSNYLNFSISENLYYSKIKYANRANVNIGDVTYFSNYHKFILNSDLTKQYKDFIHNIQLEASLQVPSFEDKTGDIADFISINKEEKNLKLSANQYFYNYKNFNTLTIRTNQMVYLKRDNEKYGDIFNEIIYNYSKTFSVHENVDFSSRYNKIKKIQSTLNYRDDFYNFSLSHTHQNVPNEKKINYLTTSLKLNLLNGYELESSLDYDIKRKITRSWSTKLYKDNGCWNYSIKYKESIIPIFTSAGVQSYKNKGLYFLVNFANIGGISYEYTRDDISSGGENNE